MHINKNVKAGGYLFILSGIAFAVAALLSEQVVFFGVAAAFIVIGTSFIVKSKKQNT
jgi:hypothetical protein